MTEFLGLAERAWTPDAKIQAKYRPSLVSCHVFPASGAGADAAYSHMVEGSESEVAQFGPKMLLFRDNKEKEADGADKKK